MGSLGELQAKSEKVLKDIPSTRKNCTHTTAECLLVCFAPYHGSHQEPRSNLGER